MSEIKLNVGCGADINREGYIGIDAEDWGQQHVMDIEKTALPYADDSVDEILCQHVLEHICHPINVINEFWRVLKPDGKLTIIVPHMENPKAYVIDHTAYFNEHSFDTLEYQYKKSWQIIEVAKNERPDVVVILKPKKT